MAVEEQHYDTIDEQFIKVDFHIHTPQSKCYGESRVTAEQIVDTALSTGLAAITLTDHNTAGGVDNMREAGDTKGLVVFPGTELSTSSGHVLALFDRETPLSYLEDFIGYVGASAAARGDGAVFIDDSIEDVFRKIDEYNGIAIAAHIERWPTGFLQTKESRRTKTRIHSSQYLTALEITQPQNRGLWNSGKMRGYPKKYACIQGSDAHALDEIGRRPTYLKLPSLDLTGLQLAFSEYENRIRFPEEMPEQS
jgi:hypothetical protein